MIRTILSLIQAFLFVVSSFSVIDSNFKEWVDWAAIGVSSTTQFSFPTIDAQALKVTTAETERCRAWFDANVRFADGVQTKPAYRFSAGGKSLWMHPQDWTITPGEESAEGAVYRGGKTTYITLKHQKSGLVATVEATIYEAYATCEWTVYIENTAAEMSPVVSAFYAADCTLPTGYTTLYTSKGGGADANDFELHRSFVNTIPMRFNANGGRTESTLPYFNLSGNRAGVVMAVGWTGQWYTTIAQRLRGVAVRVKQETFSAELLSGEKVRSPLVTLTFYDGGNALKGFNTFRAWESACVMTQSATEITTTGLASEFSTETADEMVRNIRNMPQDLCDRVNFLWMDAGWYARKTNWYDSVGNWTPDPKRFPEGLAPISEAAAERGMGLLLWYEPERCCADTDVYNEAIRHEGWLLRQDEDVNMLNLANDDACDYLGNLIAESLHENKVGLYRQDFNFVPLYLWQEADETLYGGRKGITENHYVTNLYRYLDRLLARNPGLIIDNCASGGKRLDIEMTRRSIPLWRNDYNCVNEKGEVKPDILEATQVNTYGLCFWLPLHGTGANVPGEYGERTNIVPCSQFPVYGDVREYMTGQYFPLTYGGLRTNRFHAMQFGSCETGTAVIYKREKVRTDTYLLRLNGLENGTLYTVRNYDDPGEVYSLTGEKLMKDGIRISIQDAPKAAIYLYAAAE